MHCKWESNKNNIYGKEAMLDSSTVQDARLRAEQATVYRIAVQQGSLNREKVLVSRTRLKMENGRELFWIQKYSMKL
jgi:hypothetical protein